MDVRLARAFEWFCAVHGLRYPETLPDDSAFYDLVFEPVSTAEAVYDALLRDSRRHRVHLDARIMAELRPPDPTCACRGTGRLHVAGGLSSLCELCMSGDEAGTWLS